MTLDDLARALSKHLDPDHPFLFSHLDTPASLLLLPEGEKLSDALGFLRDFLKVNVLLEDQADAKPETDADTTPVHSVKDASDDRSKFEKMLDHVYLTRLEVDLGDTIAESTFFIGLQLHDATWDFGDLPGLGHAVSLKDPGLVLGRVGPDGDWEVEVTGTIALWTADFDVTLAWPSRHIDIAYDGPGIDVGNVLTDLNCNPAALTGTLSEIALSVDLPSKAYTASFELDGAGIGGLHAFRNLRLAVDHDESGTVTVLEATTRLAEGLTLDLSARLTEGDLVLTGAVQPNPAHPFQLGKVAREIGNKVGLHIPEIPVGETLVLTKLALEYHKGETEKTSVYALEAGLSGDDGTVADDGPLFGFSITSSEAGATKSAYLKFGDEQFDVQSTAVEITQKDASGQDQTIPVPTLAATYTPDPPKEFRLKEDLVAHLTSRKDVLEIMPSLKVDLNAVTFAQVTLPKDADDKDGETVKAKMLGVALETKAALDLSGLPIVGSAASALGLKENIGVSGLKVAISTAAVPLDILDALNAALPEAARLPAPEGGQAEAKGEADAPKSDAAPKKKPGLSKGFNVAGQINTGLEMISLLAGSTDTSDAPAEDTDANAAQDAAATEAAAGPAPALGTSGATAPSDDATWFKIEKKLGPFYLHRFGLGYREGEVWAFPDADLTISALTLSLEGFAISTPLDRFDPTFHLQGFGLDYKKPPMEIGGAFLRIEGDGYEEYCGSLVIKTETLSLAAVGSYARLDDGPSMFVYLDLKYPLGGPPFFFVTGLAGGFGYNRALKVPGIDGLSEFPFITIAMDNKPAPKKANEGSGTSGQSVQEVQASISGVLTKLGEAVPPTVGDQWFAAGVHFTSFEIVDGFVLLTVAFGHAFEMHVLGMASFSYPPKATASEDSKPLVHVDLLVEASYLPAEGTVEMAAKLGEGSFVFDPDCHLTGGLAFKTWFSGALKDEFVFTLGGYHPKFKPPAGYPVPARLAFNWQKSDALTVKGGMYFAITGHALMAGGYLDAVFESGALKAWFKVNADFLIEYKPFHYDAEMSVDIGAEVTIHFFGTHHLSVHLGADLHVWGPSFSGTASFDIWIASFSVSFGDGAQKPPPIAWDEFRGSFLPKDEGKIVSIQAVKGLVKELKATEMTGFDVGPSQQPDATHWMVNSHHLDFAISMIAPDTQAGVQAGIPAMGLTPDDVRISHSIKVMMGNGADGEEVPESDFNIEAVQGGAPAGLWGDPRAADINSSRNIADTVRQFRMTAPPKPDGDTPIEVERKSLSFDTEVMADAFGWRDPQTTAATWTDLGEVWAATGASDAFDTACAPSSARAALFKQFLPPAEVDTMTGAVKAEDLLVRAAAPGDAP